VRVASKTDRALILRRFRYGESSLVVHALTPRFGRIALLAKGAYRLRSGYFGVLDLFDTLELTWRDSRTDLGTLAAARILCRRRGLSGDLDRYRAGISMLELARLGAREKCEEARLFAHTEGALEGLQEAAVDPGMALIAFDLGWLALSGLAPAFENCAACGRSSLSSLRSPEAFFSHGGGGLLCSTCRTASRSPGEQVVALPWKVVQTAHTLATTPPEHLPRLRLCPQPVVEVGQLVARFLEYHLERRLRSRKGPDAPERRGSRGKLRLR
jgi:DNA repair protein RecO (recombination protein O)